MSSAYYIQTEREVDGLNSSVCGKSLAKCKHLDGLAARAGVKPLLEFFSMNPEEAESLFDSDEEDEDAESLAPQFDDEQWFEAEEGLLTVRGMLTILSQGPVDLPDDPVPDFFPGITLSRPTPRQEDVMDDLRDFETVLTQLAAAGVRWHLAVDF